MGVAAALFGCRGCCRSGSCFVVAAAAIVAIVVIVAEVAVAAVHDDEIASVRVVSFGPKP